MRSTYDDTHLLVAYVPDVVLRSDTAFFAELPFELSGSHAQGSLGRGRHLRRAAAAAVRAAQRPIFTVDALRAALGGSHYEVGISATNLLDTQYRLGEYNYASDFHSSGAQQPTLVPERHFTAGAPRAIFATVSVNFGGV